MPITSINPATNKKIREFEEYSDRKVDQILNSVQSSLNEWRVLSYNERAKFLKKAAKYLRENCDVLAKIITQEMGKPIKQAKAEIKKCATVCTYYATNAKDFLSVDAYESDASKSVVQYEPLGTVLAVMPWNYPFWQVFRFAAPTLMAGNTAVLKHASNVSKCALAIEKVFSESGFPKDVFRTLLISGKRTEPLLKDSRIHAVTLTGSELAGAKVAAQAGRNIKKAVLELGGSDPYIVLPDANVKRAAKVGVQARFQNTGQSCIAAKRFILHADIADQFIELFLEGVNKLLQGDPAKESTDLGPMARKDLRDTLHKQVSRSMKAGAKVLVGAKMNRECGFYYPPTVLDDVGPSMPAYNEELFGPVAAIIRARSEEQAIEIANDTSFGLGSSVWTEDKKRAERFASKIQAGAVFINAMVKSDPRLPFGGIKKSGFGRELSDFGIREFVNIKTVYMK